MGEPLDVLAENDLGPVEAADANNLGKERAARLTIVVIRKTQVPSGD